MRLNLHARALKALLGVISYLVKEMLDHIDLLKECIRIHDKLLPNLDDRVAVHALPDFILELSVGPELSLGRVGNALPLLPTSSYTIHRGVFNAVTLQCSVLH